MGKQIKDYTNGICIENGCANPATHPMGYCKKCKETSSEEVRQIFKRMEEIRIK